MKKSVLVIGGVVLAVVVAGLIIGGQMFGLFEKVPEPEITSGEFDFSLTYELEGKTETIEGTYVCKYKGVTKAIDGVGRDWEGYIEGHEEGSTYEIAKTEDGTVYIDLDLFADFFMSDPFFRANDNENEKKPSPSVYIVYNESYDNGETAYEASGEFENETFRIVSFEYDEPIKNTYK